MKWFYLFAIQNLFSFLSVPNRTLTTQQQSAFPKTAAATGNTSKTLQTVPIFSAQSQGKMGRLGKIDPSSFSQPELITTKHSVLRWKVDFENTRLKGTVTHRFNVLQNNLSSIVSS